MDVCNGPCHCTDAPWVLFSTVHCILLTNSLLLFFFLPIFIYFIWVLHTASWFLLCVFMCSKALISLLRCCDQSFRIRHCGQSKNTLVVGFSTSCLWPLWRVSLLSVLRQGEINTFNVMCGQWNEGMIYVGMASPPDQRGCVFECSAGEEGWWHNNPDWAEL